MANQPFSSAYNPTDGHWDANTAGLGVPQAQWPPLKPMLG